MDHIENVRRARWEDRMEREGLKRCDACGWWGNDVEPLTVGPKGHTHTAELCTSCRREIQ
jgi:hypothetical protein